ncbi:MAG TPA: hypothetical protein VFU07_01585 [Candidatus Lumbricidophila sp.]|nr:hypothetical protein [Candidatus Lumbricidophila sp.]
MERADQPQIDGWGAIVAVWILAVALGAWVVLAHYSGVDVPTYGTHDWFGVFGALGACFGGLVVIALVVQLATKRAAGYVARVSVTVAGSAIVLAICAAALTPLLAR